VPDLAFAETSLLLHGVLASARDGDIMITESPLGDTDAALAATELADLTPLVIGLDASLRDVVPAAADTLARLVPHAHRRGLVLADQCPLPSRWPRTSPPALLAPGETGPLPTHTWHPEPGSVPAPRATHSRSR
jgi:hypothetical protein